MDKPLETLGQPCLAQLDARELATVLAALRQRESLLRQLLQDSEPCTTTIPEIERLWLIAIATNWGRLEPLDASEIDALCERLNAGPLDRQPPDSPALAILKAIVDDASPCTSACSRMVDLSLIERAEELLAKEAAHDR